MRVVLEKPCNGFKLTIYSWNNKYILKYEKGMYEQTYKVSELDLTGDSDILKIAEDEIFVEKIMTQFHQMHQQLHITIAKL